MNLGQSARRAVVRGQVFAAIFAGVCGTLSFLSFSERRGTLPAWLRLDTITGQSTIGDQDTTILAVLSVAGVILYIALTLALRAFFEQSDEGGRPS